MTLILVLFRIFLPFDCSKMIIFFNDFYKFNITLYLPVMDHNFFLYGSVITWLIVEIRT